MSLRSRNATAGLLGGFFGAANRRRNKAEARMQYLADNRALQDTEMAKSQYELTKKNARMEQLKIADLRSKGHIESTSMNYTDKYWEDQGFAKSGLKDRAEYAAANRNGYFTELARKGSDTAYNKQYGDIEFTDAAFKRNMEAINSRQAEMGSQRAQPSALGRLLTGGSEEEEAAKLANAGTGAQLEPLSNAGGQGQEREYNPDVPIEYQGVPEEPSARTGLQKVNIQNQNGEDVDGVFWMDPSSNEITGPGLKGFIDASEFQVLPQDRKPLTTQWTDESTNEEMKGDLIETFPGDPNAVLKRGGKTYVPIGTPVKLRGSQDQHGPKALSSAQNKLLVRQDSAESVQILVGDLLSQDYKGNPAGWVASRLSTIGSMFSSLIPDLGGDEEDLEAIVKYIKGNVEGDIEASSALGLLDARAVAEGNVEAISTLLSYGTVLWMNGGTRVTKTAQEDANNITKSFIHGTSAHMGSLASLQNQTAKDFAYAANLNLSAARTDDRSPLWNQYPTAKKYHERGWDFASDKAEGLTLKRSLDELKKSDPEVYQRSLDSLESTMSSYDTIGTPIFWSKKYGTNVMLYHRTDPKTGAIKFRTMKVR